MAITITGSKYGALAVSNISDVNRVVVSTAPFVTGDFTKGLIGGRIVALWSNGAAAFKGVAWVRRFVGTNTLELEAPFIDPATGATVAQVVGDVVHVSKNWAEVAQAGIAVDNERVNVTDTITWGTAGAKDSVCFYDEGVHVRFAPFSVVNEVLGGCVVQGHIEDYAAGVVSGGCKWVLTSALAGQCIIRANSDASGAFLFFGGGIESIGAGAATGQVVYLGSLNGAGTDFSRFVTMGAQLYGVDLLSRNSGGNWTAPQNHVIRRCTVIDANVNNGILSRWGNGVIDGTTLKIMRFSDLPISIYGSDNIGTFSISSAPDTRTVIRDVGNGNVLWRSAGSGAQVINYTNIVTPTQASASEQPVTQNFSFQDTITNLATGSAIAIVESSTSTVAASVAASSTTWTSTVEFDKIVNSVRQSGYRKGPWVVSVKRYGYTPVTWAFAETSVDLGPAGMAPNVTWGRSVLQAADTNITLTKAQAEALTNIVTLDELYDALVVWSVRSAGNMLVPSAGAYPASANGSTLNLGNFSVVLDPNATEVVAIAGNVITVKSYVLQGGAKFTRLVTTGTLSVVNGGRVAMSYGDSTGTFYMVSVPNFQIGRIQLYNLTTGQQLFNDEIVSDLVTLVQASPGDVIRLRADHDVMLPLESTAVMTSSGITFLDAQVADTVYLESGLDGSTVTEFAADGPNIQIDINDPDGITTVQRLYAWLQYYQTTPLGIASPFFGAMVATDAANFIIDQTLVDLKLDNISGAPLRIVGGYLTRKDGSTIIASTSGSIQMDPGKAYAVTVAGSGTGTVDNAAIAAAVWANATRTLTTSSAPTAAQVATAVRTELATELGRVDANVSSRLATAGYTAPTAAPTAAQVATAVRTELAPELARVDASVSSRLPTTSYTAPTASPTAAQVASAVRVELATELGRIDTSVSSRLATVSYVAPYALAAVATAVRTELATELDRIDVATSSRLAAISYAAPTAAPSAASVASAVRAELGTELGRIDTTVSSRLAAVSYVAPSAPDTAAISTAVWSAATRTLTVASGMTEAQELKIDQTKLLVEQVQTKVDATL